MSGFEVGRKINLPGIKEGSLFLLDVNSLFFYSKDANDRIGKTATKGELFMFLEAYIGLGNRYNSMLSIYNPIAICVNFLHGEKVYVWRAAYERPGASVFQMPKCAVKNLLVLFKPVVMTH